MRIRSSRTAEAQIDGNFESDNVGSAVNAVVNGYSRQLYHELVHNSRKRGGAHDTIQRRERTLMKFCVWARWSNLQMRHAAEIKNRHFRNYIEHLKMAKKPLGIGTLQNIAADLRTAAPQLSFTNKELGIARRSRKGTRLPCPDALYEQVRAGLGASAMRAVLGLQRYLGLRAAEAISAGPCLRDWERALEHGWPVYVYRGTKGGRARYVTPADREAALRAVREAIAAMAANRGQVLVRSRTRRTALKRYWSACHALGLSGQYSPHSLRYRFAQDLIMYFAGEGFSEAEAFSAVSVALGHGDGRGRYIKSVYGQGMPAYAELVKRAAARARRNPVLGACGVARPWSVGWEPRVFAER